MAIWPSIEDEMSDEIDAEFGEPFVHLPKRRLDVNKAPEDDPDRPSQEGCGIFEWRAIDVFLSKGQDATRAPPASHHSSRRPELSIDARRLDWDVRAHDFFELPCRGLLFEAVDVRADGQGRIVVQLNQRGRHLVKETS